MAKMKIVLAALALLAVAGCDNHKPSTQAAGTPAQVAQALPPEIAQTAGNVNGAAWMEFYYSLASCRPRDVPTYDGRISVLYKGANVPWEKADSANVIFAQEARRTMLDDAIAGLRNSGAIQEINRVTGFLDRVTCFNLSPDKIPGSVNTLYDDASVANRGAIRIGLLTLDRVELVSEFERSRPYEGIVAKYRKYRLFATLVMNPQIGNERVTLERDLVIYFDPEDRVWRPDQYEGQYWFIQSRTNPVIPRAIAPTEETPAPSAPPPAQSTPAPTTPAPATQPVARGMDNESCPWDDNCRRLVFSAAGETDAIDIPSGQHACFPPAIGWNGARVHLWNGGADLGVFPIGTRDATGAQHATVLPAFDRIALVRVDQSSDHVFVWFTRNGLCF